MFQVHFHFEESYAAWIQAITAIIGVFFLIRAYQQSNKSHELQITALRNATRPHLKLVELPSSERSNSDDIYENVGIQVTDKPAMHLKITPQPCDFARYYTKTGNFNSLNYPHLDVLGRVEFYLDIDFQSVPAKPGFEYPTFSCIADITYNDENGYMYKQTLIFSAENAQQRFPRLTDVIYL